MQSYLVSSVVLFSIPVRTSLLRIYIQRLYSGFLLLIFGCQDSEILENSFIKTNKIKNVKKCISSVFVFLYTFDQVVPATTMSPASVVIGEKNLNLRFNKIIDQDAGSLYFRCVLRTSLTHS